jgi:hypothetical protein
VHQLAVVISWIGLIVGVFVLAFGAIVLTTRRLPPWLREKMLWRPYGWSQLCFGAFVLIETAPRIAGAPAALGLALSIVAVVPLVAGLVCLNRAQADARERSAPSG